MPYVYVASFVLAALASPALCQAWTALDRMFPKRSWQGVHINDGHYSFNTPSGIDNSATEASLNKLFTPSWPLQLFVQLTAFWRMRTMCCCAPHMFQAGKMIGQTTKAEVG